MHQRKYKTLIAIGISAALQTSGAYASASSSPYFINNSSEQFSYSEGWALKSNRGHGNVNDDVTTTLKSGEIANFEFNGEDTLTLLSELSPLHGSADVFVDEINVGTIDLYSNQLHVQDDIFTFSNYLPGNHQVSIVTLDNTYFMLDALYVEPNRAHAISFNSGEGSISEQGFTANNSYSGVITTTGEGTLFSGINGRATVTKALTAEQKIQAEKGYTINFNAQVVSGSSNVLYLANNNHRFLPVLAINSEGALVVQLEGGDAHTLVATGGADSFHQYQIIFDEQTGLADFMFDGVLIDSWAGVSSNQSGLYFGNGSTGTDGEILIESVTLSVYAESPETPILDSDGDGVADEDDTFPLDSSESVDTDGDGTGNNADLDDDDDGVADTQDTFPLDAQEWFDTDGDGTGDNADIDNDNNGIDDSSEGFYTINNDSAYLTYSDNWVIGNNRASDIINQDISYTSKKDETLTFFFNGEDGIQIWSEIYLNHYSAKVLVDDIEVGTISLYNEVREGALVYTLEGFSDGVHQAKIVTEVDNYFVIDALRVFTSKASVDTDNDGSFDAIDTDDDNDGVLDSEDTFPLDASESVDTDLDGTGDNADTDDDDDGVDDSDDLFPFDPDRALTYQATAASTMVNGSLSPTVREIKPGENSTFTVTPAGGYELASISGCGGTLDQLSYTTGMMDADCIISATFNISENNGSAENAINNEDHTLTSAIGLIDFSKEQIAMAESQRQVAIDALYQGIEDSISWDPSHDSITFSTFKPETTFTVLPSNVDGDGEEVSSGLVMAGELQGQRYAAMSSTLFSVSSSTKTDMLLTNMLAWLTRGADTIDGLTVVTAQVPSRADSYWFQHNEGIRNWLNINYPDTHTINPENSCDYSELSDCIDTYQPDVIILSATDRESLGFSGIEKALNKAKVAGIPLLLSNYNRTEGPLLVPLYREFGLIGAGNYWQKDQAVDVSLATIKAPMAELVSVDLLLDNLRAEIFDTSVLDGCTSNYLYCGVSSFQESFKTAANWYRNGAQAVDQSGLALFSSSEMPLLKAGLLLADKYRSEIDYPIAYDEYANWQKALFADFVVSYGRKNNLPQPDLGEFVTDKSNLENGSNAHYAYPTTVNEDKTFSVNYSGTWTTSGWYALPGKTLKLTRRDSSSATVNIKLNYHRYNTNRVYEQHIYRGPLELAQNRLTLAAGESIEFSTPYGGPIYIYLSGSELPLSVDLAIEGAAKHPAIMDFSSEAEVATFNERIEGTEIPHVDLRNDGAEQHLRRDRFLGAINDTTPDVTALLDSVAEDHINSVYTLAGFKIQGKSLTESLPKDVSTACVALFGEDCIDTVIHNRETIQHANYDQNAHCGGGCSGNPWDSYANISPTGWLDNHELGHNLQVNRLNVQYVTDENSDNWASYASRAGENSNNIFPYFVKWKAHYLRDGNSDTITDTHMNHKDLFYVFMSDAAKTVDSDGNRVVYDRNCSAFSTGEDRYTAPWSSNAYATSNGYRMSFYFQMMLKAHGMTLRDGTTLENGFNLMTLLYLQSRLFGQYADDALSWAAKSETLGFGLFPYSGDAIYGGNTVSKMPGNDFMLVALSQLTNQDWRSHFDMMGLRYSTLAEQQVIANAPDSAMPMGMYELETEVFPLNLSDDMTFIPLSLDDPTTLWKGVSSPTQCE